MRGPLDEQPFGATRKDYAGRAVIFQATALACAGPLICYNESPTLLLGSNLARSRRSQLTSGLALLSSRMTASGSTVDCPAR